MNTDKTVLLPLATGIQPSDYERVLKRPVPVQNGLDEQVRRIIQRVEQDGDKALRELSLSFDGYLPESIELSRNELLMAGRDVDDQLKAAIHQAMLHIKAFHEAQLPRPVTLETMPGVRCSLRYEPIKRVGLYIPGGTAPLLSTVLMTAIPAVLAGCRELIACTPPGAPPELLYTLSLFPLRVFLLGGAQAIAAMALGTESVPRADKIFGPGNAYVTEAKMQLAGRGIAIDVPAGPSEVMVIADHTAVPEYVAADLLSQAEHGSDSQVILLATQMDVVRAVQSALNKQLEVLPRKDIAEQALKSSMAICVNSMEEAIEISNFYGPEHLILAVEAYDRVSKQIHNAGSVFLGNYSPESAGDYASGTNHTLPTGGFTRAWSGITTSSFMKSISFQEITREGLLMLAPSILQLARAEQLEAHAAAVLQRISNKQTP